MHLTLTLTLTTTLMLSLGGTSSPRLHVSKDYTTLGWGQRYG